MATGGVIWTGHQGLQLTFKLLEKIEVGDKTSGDCLWDRLLCLRLADFFALQRKLLLLPGRHPSKVKRADFLSETEDLRPKTFARFGLIAALRLPNRTLISIELLANGCNTI